MTQQFHTHDGAGNPITVRVGPMNSAVAYKGHISPDEQGEVANPPKTDMELEDEFQAEIDEIDEAEGRLS